MSGTRLHPLDRVSRSYVRVLFQVHGMLHIVLPQIPIFPVYLPGRPGAKHLFSLTTWDIPAVVNRAIGFLKREASGCLERTSIRTGFLLPDTR